MGHSLPDQWRGRGHHGVHKHQRGQLTVGGEAGEPRLPRAREVWVG